MLIRDFCEGDEATLWEVYFSSIHDIANKDYSPEQLDAWAPRQHDERQWAQRIRGINPYIAEVAGCVVGYADLQESGYIDHFFVAGPHHRRGVGHALMEHIHQVAKQRGLLELYSDVSLTAEPFFAKHGFVVEARKSVVVRGVTLSNARMRKRVKS